MRNIILSSLALLALALGSPAWADALNINAQTGTSYTFANTDCSKLVTFSNSGSIAATLPQASSQSGGGAGAGTFMPPCDIKVINKGTGTLTITPTTSTIAGASTLVLTTGQGAEITSDGTNYQAAAYGGSSVPSGGTTGQLLQGVTSASPTWATVLSGAYDFTNALISYGNSAGTPTHIATQQGTAPALTSCGGGSPAITGTDTAGIVTMGTSATGCVITFNVAYTSTPYCVVSWIATPLASQSYVTSTAAITLTQTSTSGNKVQYICVAQSGG
jgi:hypothetical protein